MVEQMSVTKVLSGAKEYGDKMRAINAKKDVIRAKEQQ